MEWVSKVNNDEKNENVIQCLIFININFILYHTSINLKGDEKIKDKDYYVYSSIKNINFVSDSILFNQLNSVSRGEIDSFTDFISSLEDSIYYKQRTNDPNENKLITRNRSWSQNRMLNRLSIVHENINMHKSLYFINKFQISKNVDVKVFNKINNFIETGILIKDKED